MCKCGFPGRSTRRELARKQIDSPARTDKKVFRDPEEFIDPKACQNFVIDVDSPIQMCTRAHSKHHAEEPKKRRSAGRDSTVLIRRGACERLQEQVVLRARRTRNERLLRRKVLVARENSPARRSRLASRQRYVWSLRSRRRRREPYLLVPRQARPLGLRRAEGDPAPTALRRHDPAKDGILRVRGREPRARTWSPARRRTRAAPSASYLPQHMPTSCGVCTRSPPDICREAKTSSNCGSDLTSAMCFTAPAGRRRESVQKRPPPTPVAVDAGARRLWLSDDIRFVGNAALG